MSIPTFRACHFEASEEIMTNLKSQGLHIIRIKYWNASWSGPSLLYSCLLSRVYIYVIFLRFGYLMKEWITLTSHNLYLVHIAKYLGKKGFLSKQNIVSKQYYLRWKWPYPPSLFYIAASQRRHVASWFFLQLTL